MRTVMLENEEWKILQRLAAQAAYAAELESAMLRETAEQKSQCENERITEATPWYCAAGAESDRAYTLLHICEKIRSAEEISATEEDEEKCGI